MSVPTPILQYNLSDASVKGLLPSGYTPLAYIESTTAGEYIDTGFKYSSGNITVDCEYTIPSNNDATIFGCSNNNSKWLLLIYRYSNASGHYCGTISGTWGNSEPSGGKRRITYSISGTTCTLNDGKQNVSGSCGTIPALTYSYTLWCHHYNGSFVQKAQNARIYYFRLIYQGNLTLDYRPARRDSDGVIGMYDLVSRTFKTNSGSGAFIAGPELAIGKGGGKSLPEEYLLVEYLEGTGTLWINTGYLCNSSNVPTLKYKLDAMATDKGVGNRWWACGIGGGSGITFHVGIGNGSTSTFPFTHGTGVTDRLSGINGSLNTRYKWELNMNNSTYKVWSADGTILVNQTFTKATPTQSLNLALFRWYSYSGSGYIFGMKIYRVELYNGSTKVVDMFPVYRKSDGKPGMYDVIRNTFYTNAGTGEFILGPSISNTYTYEPINGKNLWKKSSTWNATNSSISRLSDLGFNGVPGPWTISFDAYASLNTSAAIDICDLGNKTISLTTTPQHYFITATATNYYTVGNYNGFFDIAGFGNGVTVYLSNIAMYNGDIDLGYKPSNADGLYVNCNSIYDANKGWCLSGNDSIYSYVEFPKEIINPLITAKTFTIAFWFRVHNTNRHILFGSNASYPLNIEYYTSGTKMRYYFAGSPDKMGSTTIATNTWYHVTLCVTSTGFTAYINGNVDASHTSAPTFNQFTGNCRIGSDSRDTQIYLGSDILNFMIFNTALTAAQVKELYGK